MARLFTGLCVLVFASLCSSRDLSEPSVIHRFLKFINDYKKPYENGTREFELRLENFKINLQRIEELNEPYGEGDSAVYGITKFSDLSQEEFRALYLNDLHPKRSFRDVVLKFHSEKSSGWKPTASLHRAQKIDWRDVGAVSPVKNQGTCGACWAFAATESVESAFAITYNTSTPELAVQQLIDCSTKTYGCKGGDICAALSYIETRGITYEENYPLTDRDGVCRALPPEDKIVKITSYKCNNYVGKEDQILDLLWTVGPVSVAVDASTWNNYVGGIIKFHCEDSINHAVDIIGYDLTGPVPYYIVRNSWGTDFGMDGYMYIKVGSNLCGIAEEVADVHIK